MTIQEAGQRLGKSESTIRRWIRTGKLTAAMINGAWDIPEAVVNDLSNDQQPVGNEQSLVMDQLRSENRYLKERIQELEEARERSDTIILQLSRQLEQSQRLLEHHKAPWWRRWSKKRSS